MVQTAKITKLSRKMARQQPRINEEKEKVTNAKKKIAELNKNMLESNYGKYCSKLNVIFNSFNTDVKKILKDKNIKSRTKKITFQDALAYMFLYNQIGKAIMNNDIFVLNKNLQVIARQSSVFNQLTKLRTSLIPIIPIVVLPVIILPNLVINNAI